MSDTEVIDIVQQAILLMIQISSPVMIVGLVVGVVIALMQALTQVQEMTLAFVPKIIAILFSMFLLMPMMATTLVEFMNFLADKIVGIG